VEPECVPNDNDTHHATRITQIFNDASPLQAAGRTHCEYTFYITRPAFALCAEAALTPQYTLTHNTLGNIVSRIYILIVHKCPEMFSVVDNPAAFAGQFTFAERSFFKKFFSPKKLTTADRLKIAQIPFFVPFQHD
jgi:hypothetical protein